MAGQISGMSSNKSLFRSIAESFSFPPSPENTQISSEEAPAQSNAFQEQPISSSSSEKAQTPSEEVSTQSLVSQEQLFSQSTNSPPVLHDELWKLIGGRLSTMDDFRNFSMVSAIHFRVGCAILFKTFQPRTVGEAVKLFALPTNRIFNRQDSNYDAQPRRLIRELVFSRGCLKPRRGNLIKIADMLLSGKRPRTLQDLIDIELLSPQDIEGLDLSTLPGVDQNGRLSSEHASFIFNNLAVLLTQEATPNIVALLRIPPNKINREIFEIVNDIPIDDTPIDNETKNRIINDIFESKTRLHAVDEAGRPLFRQHLLYWAAANNKMERVKELLEDGVSINVYSEIGGSALHGAMEEGHAEMIKLLIEQDASLNIYDEDGDTPFLIAVRSQSREILETFLDTCDAAARNSGKKPASITLLKQCNAKSHFDALQLAVEHQNFDNVKYLVERGASINSAGMPAFQQESKNLALRLAVEQSTVEIAGYLLEHNAIPNQEWYDDKRRLCTLLHIAILNNDNVDMLRLLLANKTEELFNKHKINLLHLAAACGELSILEFIVDKSRDLFDDYKEALLDMAIPRLHFNTVKYLLERPGEPINLSNGNSWTPLHRAIEATGETIDIEGEAQARCGIVGLLLEHGADVDVFHGLWNPLNLAISKGQLEVVKLLVERDADIYAAPPVQSLELRDQRTPLTMAIASKRPDIFAALIQSPRFDKSHSNANFRLLEKVASFEGTYSQRLFINKKYPMLNSLLAQLEGGASAVLKTAYEHGREDIVKIFLQTQDADFIFSQEIFNQPQVLRNFNIEPIPQDDSDSDITVSELGSDDESF